jgi:hypothetical protein
MDEDLFASDFGDPVRSEKSLQEFLHGPGSTLSPEAKQIVAEETRAIQSAVSKMRDAKARITDHLKRIDLPIQ